MTLKPHKLNEKKIDSQFSQLIKNFQSHLRNVGFNAWVKDSDLAKPENRRVADVAEQIMMGAAFLYRLQSLKLQGISLPVPCWNCSPCRDRACRLLQEV